ncbi:IS481 family transposase [Microbispora sp. GKU 823]|uniref:IS481 family transposase n=1 Tax=Microbispora sp. GKU 823 TaxID=1652100 RepID=UPI0009A351A8|nr:IS481 family transposase [Microbispora sp. GKU 823]OPG14091.1 IS481 family transposase [Microbispora sp. GKU 823]
MPHRNAPLTETGRLRLARCIVEDGWSIRRAAERFQVSHTTAARWAHRYRTYGAGGMADRPSRPHHSPTGTDPRTERRIVKLRVTRRWGPARIAARLGIAPSSTYAVLRRYRVPPLAHLDRASGRPIRRYERERPGELVHIDVKKLGNIPDGGGHRIVGRAQGDKNKQATTTRRRNSKPVIGYSYLHTALDDHSRLAYTEILPDERKDTAAGFLARATAWFAARNVTIQRVLTDNGACYKSHMWAATCTVLGITHKRTRPYRPQTNGKVERFHRTLADEWAYARPYASEAERRTALDPWLHMYNHHRGHTALKGQPPISRVTNLPGEYI